jgi:hypothetical protein
MSRNLIIHTAILICSAFIFRLCIINAGIIFSSDTPNTSLEKTHSSTLLKRKKQAEVSSHTISREYALPEVFEEDSDENKFKPKVNFQILYSLVTSEVESKINELSAFGESPTYISTNRHILLQVFRI